MSHFSPSCNQESFCYPPFLSPQVSPPAPATTARSRVGRTTTGLLPSRRGLVLSAAMRCSNSTQVRRPAPHETAPKWTFPAMSSRSPIAALRVRPARLNQLPGMATTTRPRPRRRRQAPSGTFHPLLLIVPSCPQGRGEQKCFCRVYAQRQLPMLSTSRPQTVRPRLATSPFAAAADHPNRLGRPHRTQAPRPSPPDGRP